MPRTLIEWHEVYDGNEPIGAIGFINSKIALIVAYHDDRDGNFDGKIGKAERFITTFWSVEGKATTRVAMKATADTNIVGKDASIREIAHKMYFNFAAYNFKQGVYMAYFRRGVSMVSKNIVKYLTDSMIKEMVIRKGFENAVKDAFMRQN